MFLSLLLLSNKDANAVPAVVLEQFQGPSGLHDVPQAGADLLPRTARREHGGAAFALGRVVALLVAGELRVENLWEIPRLVGNTKLVQFMCQKLRLFVY